MGVYTDCDCAVKMLPRYASENARTEFVHEIQLMKTLGLHDNIVNMLGCITAGKSCLVLEYCANRDLLRYLKQKKVELEIVTFFCSFYPKFSQSQWTIRST